MMSAHRLRLRLDRALWLGTLWRSGSWKSPPRENWETGRNSGRERERDGKMDRSVFSEDAVPTACTSLLYVSIKVIKHRKTR